MRHRIAHRKLGRVTEHRIALLRNQADALLRHERIRTTVAKAKELRPFVERLITVAKRSLAEGTDNGRTVHARRLVRRDLADRKVAAKLFETIAPRFASRPGGYVRILRLGPRQGDAAEMAQIELVGSEYEPESDGADAAAATEGSASSGVGGRIRRAASRIRGRRDDESRGRPGRRQGQSRRVEGDRQAHPQEGLTDGARRRASLLGIAALRSLLGLRVCDDLAVQVRGDFLVVRELHVVRAPAAGG